MRGDPSGQSETFEAGGGEDQEVVVAIVQLAETGADVAADRGDVEARVRMTELCTPSDAAGADPETGGRQNVGGDTVGWPVRRDDDTVVRVGPFQYGADGEAGHAVSRQILRAVDRQVHASVD